MFLAKKILAAVLLPPLSPLLVVAAGLLLLRRAPRLGRLLAWSGVLALYLLSSAAITGPLLDTLQTYPPLDPRRIADAQAIVVLAGGTYHGAPEYGGDTVSALTLERIRYAARLARATRLPLLVTGGAPSGGRPEADSMADALTRDFGVAVRWRETASYDTRDNARYSVAILRQAGVNRVLLVTHAWHMPRAIGEFAAAGLQVIPAPTAYTGGGLKWWMSYLPSETGSRWGYYAVHEWLGIAAQRVARMAH